MRIHRAGMGAQLKVRVSAGIRHERESIATVLPHWNLSKMIALNLL